ncbi:MAG: hypothetical protein ACHQQQ_11245 [Bacteroidota bacterium]
MKFTIISLFLLLLAGCSKDVPAPTETTVPFRAGVWKGTFVDTIYYTPPQTLIQIGTATFTFSESTYTYSGSVTYSSQIGGKIPSSGQYSIGDNGLYMVKGNKVNMFDEANRRMVAWYPCLYLSGDYNFSVTGKILTIRQSTSGRTQSLTLTYQN